MARIAGRFGALTEIFRSPLRRLELSWGGYYVGEWTQFVALSVYAFEDGGAAALGVLGLVRMAPAAVALPIGGVLSDRYPRQRVLLGIYLARAASLAATAGALAAGAPVAVVFLLAAIAAVTAAPVRPATLSLVPLLARTPQELVAANVSSSTLEGLGTFAGPLIGGVLAAAAGPDVAVAAAAAVYLGCAALVAGIRREGDVAGARRRLERNAWQELLGGVRTLAREPHPRLLVLLFAAQAMVRGVLNVLVVVAAIELLDLGGAHRARRDVATGRMGDGLHRARRHRQRRPRRLGLHAPATHGRRAHAGPCVRRPRDGRGRCRRGWLRARIAGGDGHRHPAGADRDGALPSGPRHFDGDAPARARRFVLGAGARVEPAPRRAALRPTCGHNGDCFYLVAAGTVDVVHEGSHLESLGPGDYFGEIALLRDVPRVATCVARTDVELFTLDREHFVAAVGGDLRSARTVEDEMTRRLSELKAVAPE